jgi:hypothetical protein
VAYRLELPEHASIHPVFHVSQLKKAMGSKHQVILTMPADFALHLAPEQILQSRLVRRGHNQVQQVLVKWNNLPSELATWEDFEALHLAPEQILQSRLVHRGHNQVQQVLVKWNNLGRL